MPTGNLTMEMNQTKSELLCKVKEVDELNNTVAQLQKELMLARDIGRETVARTRQTQYQTLSRLQAMSDQFYEVQDEREQLVETLRLRTAHSRRMEEQCVQAIDTLDNSQELFGAAIDQIEARSNLHLKNEKMLRSENATLQAENLLLRSSLNHLQSRAAKKPSIIEQYDAQCEQRKASKQPYNFNLSKQQNMIVNLFNINHGVGGLGEDTVSHRVLEQREQISAVIDDCMSIKNEWLGRYLKAIVTHHATTLSTHRGSSPPTPCCSDPLSAIDLSRTRLCDEDLNQVQLQWYSVFSAC